MIFIIIVFDDITSTFVYLMKSTFVKINLNYYFDNTSRSSYQKKKKKYQNKMLKILKCI